MENDKKDNSKLNSLRGSLKVPKEMIDYELENKAWELAVLEKYGKNIDKKQKK